MSDPVETKLSAARTKLILDRPFLGALVLRLPMVDATDWCKTTGTDAKSFFYNREYIDALSLDQTQFMLAHDALHCALLHFSRRQHRERHRWDIACDFAINSLLVNDGLKSPPDALYLKEYEGMTAEEIYPLIDDQLDQDPLDQHLYDQDSDADDDNSQASDSGLGEKDIQKQQQKDKQNSEKNIKESSGTQNTDKNSGARSDEEQNVGEGNVPPPPLKEGEKEDLAVQWQQRMAGAAQTAMQAGKLGGGMARMVDHLLQPQLPWRMLLARYMTAVARDDYSFARPSSRREAAGAIYPSLRSSQVNLTVIIDTSGSIVDDEMSNFVSEINAIKGQMRARVTLHACDAQMAESGPWVFEAWEEMQMPEDLQGGGGTNFCPAFEWAGREDQAPDLLAYFTDAQGSFPEIEPPYPVIWLVKGKSTVPFGQRIQLN
jgi:predicted metal-dependent peptidase